MKNIEMTLPELFSAVLKHKDISNDLKVDLWNFLNDRNHNQDCDGVEMMQVILGEPKADIAERQSETVKPETLVEVKRLTTTDGAAYYEPLAKRIYQLIKSPNVSEAAQAALIDIAHEAISESGVQSEMNPFIRNNLAEAMANFEYPVSSTYLHALLTIMERIVEPEIYEEIKKQTSNGVQY